MIEKVNHWQAAIYKISLINQDFDLFTKATISLIEDITDYLI